MKMWSICLFTVASIEKLILPGTVTCAGDMSSELTVTAVLDLSVAENFIYIQVI